MTRSMYAIRPVFAPGTDAADPVIVRSVRFPWYPGLARKRQQQCIDSLHREAGSLLPPGSRLLEISSRSRKVAGRALSAFNLRLCLPGLGPVLLESAYQCAKVFSSEGPFPHWFDCPPAKLRQHMSAFDPATLQGFEWFGTRWPLQPPTLFYDWLYAHAVAERAELLEFAGRHDAFTDIAFNPKRSQACQAMALARAVFLQRRGQLDTALASPEAFASLGFPEREAAPRQSELPL